MGDRAVQQGGQHLAAGQVVEASGVALEAVPETNEKHDER